MFGRRALGCFVLVAFAACGRERTDDSQPAPDYGPQEIRLDTCRGCRCCRDGQFPGDGFPGENECLAKVLDATLAAYGLRTVGKERLLASGPYWSSSLQRSKARFVLTSPSAVRLELPPGTKKFGVQFDALDRPVRNGCRFTLKSPQREQVVDLSDHASAQFADHADGSDVPWVELELRCDSYLSIVLTELLLSPVRTPRWRSDEVEPKPAGVALSAIPAPQRDGANLIWDPPVPLAHACSDKSSDIAVGVASSATVLLALGLRPGVDELEMGAGTWLFEQRLLGDGISWKIEDSQVRLALDDGYLLRRVEASHLQRQLQVPRAKPISAAAAKDIVRRHKLAFIGEPVLALVQGKQVYLFNVTCRHVYVDAVTGKLTNDRSPCYQ